MTDGVRAPGSAVGTGRRPTKDDALDIGLAIHGVVPRIALVAVVGAAVWFLHPATFWQVSAVLAALVGAVFPRTMLGWIALVVVPLAVALQPVDLVRTCVAIVVVHIAHLLATLILTVPARSRIALRALSPTALRFVAVQAIAQAVAVIALSVPVAGGPGIAWVAPLGALAVALVAAVLIRRLR